MHWSLIGLSALVLTACHPSLESQLIGEWQSGCSIDICIITSLRADRTFSERFDQKDLSDPIVFGTWHLEGNELILHVTRQLETKVFPSAVGRDLHYMISQLQRDSFVATFAEGKNDPIHWKRLH